MLENYFNKSVWKLYRTVTKVSVCFNIQYKKITFDILLILFPVYNSSLAPSLFPESFIKLLIYIFPNLLFDWQKFVQKINLNSLKTKLIFAQYWAREQKNQYNTSCLFRYQNLVFTVSWRVWYDTVVQHQLKKWNISLLLYWGSLSRIQSLFRIPSIIPLISFKRLLAIQIT